MHLSLAVLSKQAIDCALKQNWKQAIDLNLEILQTYPHDIDAKIRLGRAYIQLKEFPKAKKIFKEVLTEDPINPIAIKNFEIAKNGKLDCATLNHLSTKALLKEPGTTYEVKLFLKGKALSASDFSTSEEIVIKAKKKSIELFKCKKNKEVLIGLIDEPYAVSKINLVLEKKGKILATYTHGKENEVYILIKASMPVFKPDKIEIRPYLKKGTIDEPELEMESEGEEETE